MVCQPPSGGCVLKQQFIPRHAPRCRQPPSGGCVLKQYFEDAISLLEIQPPSGGCVLKLKEMKNEKDI